MGPDSFGFCPVVLLPKPLDDKKLSGSPVSLSGCEIIFLEGTRRPKPSESLVEAGFSTIRQISINPVFFSRIRV